MEQRTPNVAHVFHVFHVFQGMLTEVLDKLIIRMLHSRKIISQ